MFTELSESSAFDIFRYAIGTINVEVLCIYPGHYGFQKPVFKEEVELLKEQRIGCLVCMFDTWLYSYAMPLIR